MLRTPRVGRLLRSRRGALARRRLRALSVRRLLRSRSVLPFAHDRLYTTSRMPLAQRPRVALAVTPIGRPRSWILRAARLIAPRATQPIRTSVRRLLRRRTLRCALVLGHAGGGFFLNPLVVLVLFPRRFTLGRFGAIRRRLPIGRLRVRVFPSPLRRSIAPLGVLRTLRADLPPEFSCFFRTRGVTERAIFTRGAGGFAQSLPELIGE